MKTVEIKKSEFDSEFRAVVKKLLDSAQKEVIIITGEGSAFGYQDLKWATERAIDRGVRFKIYCVNPVQEFLNKVLMLGCSVYKGKKEQANHFMIVDRKDWAVSMGKPTQVGKRFGKAHFDDKKGTRRIVKKFNDLIGDADVVKTPNTETDPLIQIINNPADWGVKTDSARFREILYR